MAKPFDLELAGGQCLFPHRRFIQVDLASNPDSRPRQDVGPGHSFGLRPAIRRLQDVFDGPTIDSLAALGGRHVKLGRNPLAFHLRQCFQGGVAIISHRPFRMFPVQGHPGLDQRQRLGRRRRGSGDNVLQATIENRTVVDHDRGTTGGEHRQGDHEQNQSARAGQRTQPEGRRFFASRVTSIQGFHPPRPAHGPQPEPSSARQPLSKELGRNLTAIRETVTVNRLLSGCLIPAKGPCGNEVPFYLSSLTQSDASCMQSTRAEKMSERF